LEALAPEARAVDNEHLTAPAAAAAEGAAPAPEENQITADEVQELASLLTVAAALFAPVLPTVAALYSPETCAAIAGVTLPVMRKHGWSIPGIMSKWGEEFALAVVVVPLGIATYKAGIADIAAMEKAAEKSTSTKPDELPAPAETVAGKPEPIFAERG
jgi:hypothetical protein